MVANADGSGATAIADIPGDWSWSDWSPDSRSMLVLWKVDGRSVISILSADGSQPTMTLDVGDIEPIVLGHVASRWQR